MMWLTLSTVTAYWITARELMSVLTIKLAMFLSAK